MNFKVIKEQRDFYRNNQYLECEEIFSPIEIDQIAKGVENTLTTRLKSISKKIKFATIDDEFMAGRDVWRSDSRLKKLLLHRNLAEIAGELLEQRPIRFGYDMWLPAIKEKPNATGPYHKFLTNDLTLNEMSCIQGVMCGAMICVSAPEIKVESASSTLFSKTLGHVVFFSPDLKLPLKDVLLMNGYCYLMIVYVNAKAVYYRQEMDPHLHDFRQLGYQFGDKLTDLNNPIVYI